MRKKIFHRVLLKSSSPKSDDHDTLYAKDVTEVLRNEGYFAERKILYSIRSEELHF